MYRTILLYFFLSLFLVNNTHSQSIKDIPGKFVYYISIKGVNTKEDVRSIEGSVRRKQFVNYFASERFPVIYFFLKSDAAVSKEQFEGWLADDKKYKVVFFGMGEDSKESAIVNSKNNIPK